MHLLFLLSLTTTNTAYGHSREPQNEWVSIHNEGGAIEYEPPPKPQCRYGADETGKCKPKPKPQPPPVVEDEQPLTPASTYQFTSLGRKFAGGDTGGWVKACGAFQIGKPCGQKDKAHWISDKFAKYLTDTMPVCVSQALAAQGLGSGYKKITAIGGTYANRNIVGGSSTSLHATGRSIDLTRLEIVLANGKSYNVDMIKSSRSASRSSAFYKKVVSCWQEKNTARCKNSGGLSGQRKGALDCTFDSNHADHVHLSMPFCPRKPGIASS